MKKFIYAIVFIGLFARPSLAQKDSTFSVHKGILRGNLTMPFGYLIQAKTTTVYIGGSLEYYAEPTVSLRGEGNFYMEGAAGTKYLKMNHSIGFGAFYHFQTHNSFDPVIGFQPEAAFTQTTAAGDPVTISPLASGIIGFNYFAEKWFHILVNLRYTAGRHLDEQSLTSLSEVSFSFGLGWNIDIIKKKL
jgi:hypothetical protein